MNTIYRIVWNVTLGKWVVASELAKGRKKNSSAKIAVLALALAGFGAPVAFAADIDPQEQTEETKEDKTRFITPFFADGGGNDSGDSSNVAIGNGAVTLNPLSTAIGYMAQAASRTGTAIGGNSKALGNPGSTAIGYETIADSGTSAGAWSGTAIGTHAYALGDGATAFGDSASAKADRAAAFGRGAKADWKDGTAFGSGTSVLVAGGTAVGSGASVAANAANSVAIGNGSIADRSDAVSVGVSGAGKKRQIINVASGTQGTDAVNVSQLNDSMRYFKANGTLLLDEAVAGGAKAIAIGSSARTSADGSVALGADSVADRANTVSVGSTDVGGQRQIVNVAKGTLATDAVNVSQLGDATRYFKANGKNDGTDDASAQGANAIAIGSNAKAVKTSAEGAIAIGNNAMAESGGSANSQGSVAMGVSSRSYNAGSVAIGFDARAGVDAAGDKAAGAHYGVSIGYQSRSANGASAVGYLAGAYGNASGAFGISATVDEAAASGLAMGNRASVTAAGAAGIALGSGSVADRGNALSVGSTSVKRQVINVAAGTADTDAVNLSQLKGTAGTVAAALGGGVTVNADGTITKPSYSVQGGTHDNVGDALGAVDSSLTSIDGRVTTNEGDIVDIRNQLGSGSIGLVQQATPTGTITVGAASGGTLVDMGGTDGDRRITGVASATSANEAVNLSQLNSALEGVSAGATRYFKADGLNDNTDDAVVTGDKAVAIGAGSVADRANTVSVGTAGKERAITNVAAGTEATDAVNVSQLKSVQDQVGSLDALAVKYDDASKGSITLGGASGTKIKNVAAGTDDTDAVNLGQLKATGLVGGDGSTLDAVVYDAGSNRGSVTFGGLGGTKLTNVMAGIVSATSTDAINGSQLWILQDQVNNLGDRVTNVENNGAPGAGPVTPQPAPGVGEGGRDPAFAANGDGGPASATGKDSVAAGTGASATADNSVAIGAGSVADRADTVSVGSAGAERQISNVAAGSQRTDAANWGQVQDALATANRYTDDRFDGVNRRIGEVQRQANRGIAASAALINVTPYMPGKTVLNAGVANYRGESALGVGVSRWNDTGRVNFNAGVSAAAGDSPIFRMGVGVVLGD